MEIKRRWSKEEDNIIRDAISRNLQWHRVAGLLPGRGGNSIKKRFKELKRIPDEVSKARWSETEITVLLEHWPAGTIMRDLQSLLPGRTSMQIYRKAYALELRRPEGFRDIGGVVTIEMVLSQSQIEQVIAEYKVGTLTPDIISKVPGVTEKMINTIMHKYKLRRPDGHMSKIRRNATVIA